jgi:hypothetical protein
MQNNNIKPQQQPAALECFIIVAGVKMAISNPQFGTGPSSAPTCPDPATHVWLEGAWHHVFNNSLTPIALMPMLSQLGTKGVLPLQNLLPPAQLTLWRSHLSVNASAVADAPAIPATPAAARHLLALVAQQP